MHDVDMRRQSLPELAAQLTEQLTRLARAELSLARAELFARGRQAVMGGGLFGAAAVLGLTGWLALVAAAIAGIAEALPVWASALIVGAALAAVAGALALAGRARLRRGLPPLAVTAGSVRADLHELTARRAPGAAPAVDGKGGQR
jgi:Putative Actinobacterial Holin-X, holin superfamily III